VEYFRHLGCLITRYDRCIREIKPRNAVTTAEFKKKKKKKRILVFKLSPCCSNDKLSSGYFPGVWILKADTLHHLLKMETIHSSETSVFNTQTPGKYLEDNLSKGEFFIRKFNVKLRENLMIFYIWGTKLFGTENSVLLKIYQKVLCTLGRIYTAGIWLYCDYFIWVYLALCLF
jgi:hypothetical protein